MAWLIYWPLLLVVAAAVAAGVAILVRKLRHGNDNPFIVRPPGTEIDPKRHQGTKRTR
jgi:hypothetical protein